MINVDIGVILVEPVQGGSGMVPATKEFLSFLRETATKVGAVLLFDEVVTSRLSYGGMQSYHNIVPDMTTVGKFFGGGLAFGAYGGRREIMDTLDTRQKGALAHSGTWHNNRFTMFTGLAATKLLSVEIIERTNQLGDKAREDLKRILGGLATVNGFGSVIGVRFGGLDPATLLSAFYFFLLSRKVYVGHRGFICLNIMHRESDVEQLLQAVMAFVEQLV